MILLVFIIVCCSIGSFIFGIKYGQNRMRQNILDALDDSDDYDENPSGEFDDDYDLIEIELDRQEVDSFGVPLFEAKNKKFN